MPRLLILLLFTAPAAVAAPVPKAPALTAEQEKEFNDLWDRRGERASAQLRYYCRLVSRPEAGVEYLRRLVKPAGMKEQEAKSLIAELGSDDEATWRRAFRDLRHRDVRLAMPLGEALEVAQGEPQQMRLAAATFGIDWPPGDHTKVSLQPPDGRPERWRLEVARAGRGSVAHAGCQTYEEQVRMETAFDGKMTPAPPDWVYALRRINSPDARQHLEALADGREGAKTTRYATAALSRLMSRDLDAVRQRLGAERRGRPLPDEPWRELDVVWQQQWYSVTTPDAADAFLDRPADAVRFLKRQLRPVKLTADGAKKLLAKLFGDDRTEVLAAVRELQVVDLQLEMAFDDLWAAADTPTKRCRLADAMMAWADRPYNAIPDDFDIDHVNHLRDYEYALDPAVRDLPRGGTLMVVWRADAPQNKRIGLRPSGQEFTFSTAKGQTHADRWYHEESAIYILDAIGSDDAVAVIKDMATGHPDAGPTKAAVAVLKRRGK